MKNFLLMLFCLCIAIVVQAQEKTVTGTVIDGLKEPLIGVSIQQKGTDNGTITDADGRFSLTIRTNADAVLVFSYIGYESKEIVVGNQRLLNVTLLEDTEQLDEVVVTGYGGTQLRSKLTNSISKVKEEHLAVGLFSNPAQALSGSVAGLKVTQATGNPAASPVIVLRGGTNLDGTGSPLILVDGQIRDDLSDINPMDIASMEVLKDAGATALYGARANNGVILVTTKRGRSGHTSINVKAQIGLNYVRNPYDFMDGGDYLYWMRKSYQNAGQVFKSEAGNWVGWNDMSTLTGNQPYGTGNIYWADAAKTVPADGNLNSSAVWSPMIYTDDLAFLLQQGWKTMIDPVYGDKLIYKDWDMAANNLNHPAISQDYNVSISGGNDRGNYYASVGYNRTEGIPLDNFYQRVNATFNADYKIQEWLTSSTSISFSDSKWNGLPNGLERNEDLTEYDETEHNFFVRMLSAPPTLRGYNANGELLLGRDYKDGNQGVNSSKFNRDYTANKFYFGESLKFQILKDLSLKVGAMWMYDEKIKEKYNQDFLQSPGNINKTRTASAYFNRIFKQTYNIVANYDFKIDQKHSLNALIGFEYLEFNL